MLLPYIELLWQACSALHYAYKKEQTMLANIVNAEII